MAISTKFYVTLPDSVAEELYNLGEFYRVGPETLAGRLLTGILQPLAAAAVDRGPITYRLMPDGTAEFAGMAKPPAEEPI